MKKLNKKQVEEIKKLREEGNTYQKIADKFQVSKIAVKYHVSEDFKDYIREYQRRKYKEMTKEQKKRYFEKKREYNREYQRRKYHSDKEFRNKQIERVKKHQKESRK